MRHAFAALIALASLSVRAQDNAAAAPPPAAAPAAPAAPQMNSHLAAAQRLYQKLDLDAALAELQQAEAGATADETVQVLIYRGLIYSDMGRGSDASDQFKRALAIQPWAEVPPETSPRVAKTFSDARKSLWGVAVKPPRKHVSAASPAPAQNAPVVSPAPPSSNEQPASPTPPPSQTPPANDPNAYQPPPK
jgi:tetratricopeptide (TPR) repeat protein